MREYVKPYHSCTYLTNRSAKHGSRHVGIEGVERGLLKSREEYVNMIWLIQLEPGIAHLAAASVLS